MLLLFQYNKNGMPHGLLKLHDLIVEDTVAYFEKGKAIRRKTKNARKAINKAIKVAKKKKRNPGVLLGTAQDSLAGLRNDIRYTRKALDAINKNMEKALKQIEKEKIEEPISLIKKASKLFEQKDIERGVALLKESINMAEKKMLLKTRTALFCGVSDEVKDLKHEMEGINKTASENSRKVSSKQTDLSKSKIVTCGLPDEEKGKPQTHITSPAVATVETDIEEFSGLL